MFFDFCQGKENHLIRKILGSILLFAMLVTAVPVMAAAEVTAPLAETETDVVDLHTLYVTEGLVSHFSVLGNAAVSADLETGVWQDRISGATATLGNKAYWERRADGSIGFDILYGVYENGKVTVTEDPAQPLATDRYAANATYAETRLGFGLALLPEDDFTVEYVAKYNPIYVATPEGEIARDEGMDKNGALTAVYTLWHDVSAQSFKKSVTLSAAKTATVPVHAYGSLVGNIETLSGVCVLPIAFAGREVLAWQSGTVTHKSGTVVPVTEGLTLTAVLASAPAITGAPTAYVTDKEAELGIRFAASFARAEYDALTAIFGAEGVRLGILVTPAQYVQMARGIFTREALSAMVTASGSTSGAAFVEIPMTAIPDAGDITVAGVLYHFHATTLAKNPAFAAIAFVDIDTDGDGTLDKTLYGDYNAAYSATAKATIAAARDTVPPLAQGWIDNLLATFGA